MTEKYNEKDDKYIKPQDFPGVSDIVELFVVFIIKTPKVPAPEQFTMYIILPLELIPRSGKLNIIERLKLLINL